MELIVTVAQNLLVRLINRDGDIVSETSYDNKEARVAFDELSAGGRDGLVRLVNPSTGVVLDEEWLG